MELQLKSPEALYALAPNLELIEKRLEASEVEAEKRNNENKSKIATARKNADRIPGLRPVNHITIHPDQYQITRIWRQGKWDVLPTIPKSGKDSFRNDISSLASTRDAGAFEIFLYQGRKGKRSKPEQFIIYLSEESKTEATPLGSIAEPTSNNKDIDELRNQFVALQKATGSPNDVAILQANFNSQLQDFKHKNEVENLKRDHKAELKEKDDYISELESEIEELQAEREEQEDTLNGVADQLTKKAEPPTFQTIITNAFVNAGEKLALKHHEVLGKYTGMNPQELKEALLKGMQVDEQKQIANENTGASFQEVAVDDEYKDFKPEHAEAIKQLHTFAKSLNETDFKTFYTICSFICTDGGDFNREHADVLCMALLPILETEQKND